MNFLVRRSIVELVEVSRDQHQSIRSRRVRIDSHSSRAYSSLKVPGGSLRARRAHSEFSRSELSAKTTAAAAAAAASSAMGSSRSFTSESSEFLQGARRAVARFSPIPPVGRSRVTLVEYLDLVRRIVEHHRALAPTPVAPALVELLLAVHRPTAGRTEAIARVVLAR